MFRGESNTKLEISDEIFFGSKNKLTENPKNEVRNSNEAGKNSYQRRIQPYYPLIWSFFDQISAKKQLKKLQKMTTILVFRRVPGFVGISNLVFRVLREFIDGSKNYLI